MCSSRWSSTINGKDDDQTWSKFVLVHSVPGVKIISLFHLMHLLIELVDTSDNIQRILVWNSEVRTNQFKTPIWSGGGVVDHTLDYQSSDREIDPSLLRSFGWDFIPRSRLRMTSLVVGRQTLVHPRVHSLTVKTPVHHYYPPSTHTTQWFISDHFKQCFRCDFIFAITCCALI